jgi:hypothetical protein
MSSGRSEEKESECMYRNKLREKGTSGYLLSCHMLGHCIAMRTMVLF